MIRRFQKKGGLGGGIDHIEIAETTGESRIVMTDGGKIHHNLSSLGPCLDLVKKGIWVELKPESEKNDTGETEVDGIAAEINKAAPVVDWSGFLASKPNPDFNAAEVNDPVMCCLNGVGEIEAIYNDEDTHYTVGVFFDVKTRVEYYTVLGMLDKNNLYPALLGYIDQHGNLSSTRPEQAIDWDNVAVDTLVEITEGVRREALYYAGRVSELTNAPCFWSDGKSSNTSCETRSSRHATYKIIKTGGK